MSIQSEVDGSPVGDDGLRHDPLPPLPEGALAPLRYSLDRLVLLVPAGSSRMSRQGGFGLLAMNASFVGGMAYWTSQVIAFGQRGFILFVLAAFAVFLGGFSSVILVVWLRLRFTEMWLLVEPSRIAVKRTLFGRSRLKTYDADPETVATFTRNWDVGDAESEEKRRNLHPLRAEEDRVWRRVVVAGETMDPRRDQSRVERRRSPAAVTRAARQAHSSSFPTTQPLRLPAERCASTSSTPTDSLSKHPPRRTGASPRKLAADVCAERPGRPGDTRQPLHARWGAGILSTLCSPHFLSPSPASFSGPRPSCCSSRLGSRSIGAA